jgi:dihydrofolate reductase
MINNDQHNKARVANKMKLSLIVATASNGVIGINGQMPWHLSADLKKFKQITLGHPILMGRKTHESIGRPLPGRENIVISRNSDYQAAGCLVFNNINQALAYCSPVDEVFVIGGAAFYQALLPHADFIYLTQIHQAFQGDTYFPLRNCEAWQEIERVDINNDDSVEFNYSFLKLQRINPLLFPL